MAILASSIFSQVRSLLDDDNSGRYTESNDLVPAVNSAIDWMVLLFTAAFESKRLSMESLSELVTTLLKTVTMETNSVKLSLDSDRDDMWTIIGVDPKPTDDGQPTPNIKDSVNKWATKLTLAEWNDSQEDPFIAGTMQTIPDDFQRIGYIGPGRFFGDEIEYIIMRPASYFSTGDKVAIWYLKNPDKVTAGTDTILFPRSVENLMVQKTLQYVSMQHGAQNPLGVITEKEITQLVNLMNS